MSSSPPHATSLYTNQHQPIENLPDSVYLNIASFMNPPDMFSFNKAYPGVANSVTTELTQRSILEPELRYAADGPPPALTIGNRCMHESHISSFIQVLGKTSPLLSPDKVKQLAADMRGINNEQPDPRLVLSGSIPLQALVGRVFVSDNGDPSDLDMYTTMNALPESRKAVMGLGLCCHNVRFFYDDQPFERGSTVISHVETYVSATDASGNVLPSISASALAKAWRRRRHRFNQGLEDLHPASPKNINRQLAVIGVGIHSTTEKHNCDPRFFDPDHPFTLDVNEERVKLVDLIVLKRNHSPDEALALFDIDACKVFFDGSKFSNIYDKIYSFKSRWDLNWQRLVNCYIPLCLPQVNVVTQRTSPKDPITEDALLLPDMVDEDEKLLWLLTSAGQACLNNPRCQLPCFHHGFNNCACPLKINNRYFFKLHFRIVKQFKRALKYIRRGIDIPLSDELITAFLGESALLKLPRSKITTNKRTTKRKRRLVKMRDVHK